MSQGLGAVAMIGLASLVVPVAAGRAAGGTPTIAAVHGSSGSSPVVPGPAPAGTYTGSDPSGAVGFRLEAATGKGGRPLTKLVIRDFEFANRCDLDGTAVTERMRVGPRGRFTLSAIDGITLSGSVYREFTGGSFFGEPMPPGLPAGVTGVASGTARLRTARCDSGALRFTAMWST